MAFKPTITVFQCMSASGKTASSAGDHVLRVVKQPCSAMIQDVYLLRAFESGSDAVMVLTCSQGECLYVEGDVRAKRRVDRVKALLDEIGMDGRRLSVLPISPGDAAAGKEAVRTALSDLKTLGPSPAARKLSASVT